MQRILRYAPALVLFACFRIAAGQSNIDPIHKFAWCENIGWANWRDANSAADGVVVHETFLSGYIWCENVGWLNVGNGDGPYANTTGEDFGVNIEPNSDLNGYAWGENIGWVNFDTGSAEPDQARFDFGARRFRGYAWGENLGWINLDDSTHFVAAQVVLRPDPWEFDEYGGSCQQDSDCWGPAETVAYCVPAPGGTFPGRCYAPANRYISIARNPDQAANTARRITLLGGGAGPWWVGSPTYNAVEDMYFASVSPTSVYAGIDVGEWVDNDWPDVIHVKGCEIAPGYTYEIQAIQIGSSESLTLKTAPLWGDIVSTCMFDHCLPPTGAFTEPSIDDVLAVVNAFTGIRNGPLPWMDVDPVFANGEPEGMWALIGDVLAVVMAFSGQPYPGNGPLACNP